MAQVRVGAADTEEVSRRLLIAALLGLLLFSTPALAGLSITDRQTATTELITGPQFFALGSGTDVLVGANTDWAGFELDGLDIDPSDGRLVLGRAGEIEPTEVPWHDPASATRACESEADQSVRSVEFDADAEIQAGRLRADLADVRVFDAASGTAVPFRTGSPEATSVVVDTTDAAAAVCVYWGDPDATSLSDASVQGPVVADGGWSWRVWEDVGNGLSLDLVDWTAASATGSVTTAQVPADVCNQCANELVGFLTPAATGSYQLFLSADDVGRLELGPGQALPSEDPPAEDPLAEDPPVEDPPVEDPPVEDPPVEDPPVEDPPAEDPPVEDPPVEEAVVAESVPVFDPATLETIIELDAATPAGDVSDPAQASAVVELEAGMAYPIRARSKDLEFGDHLEVFWAFDGGEPSIPTSASLLDIDAAAGSLTHRRFDVVATTDRSGEPDSTQRIETSETPTNACENCAHSVSGFVVVDEPGTYRLWISSDDEGELRLSTTGTPTAATRVAWLTNFTEPNNWTADPSQRSAAIELVAGQVIWMEATSRDRGGPDHLQVAWSRDDTEPVTTPSLIPADLLSEDQPVEGPLPAAELGPTEGQQSTTGTFTSEPIDTTAGGSNIFGHLFLQGEGDVVVEVSFAPSPDGPWSDGVAFIAGQPAPLAADGLRYVRLSGRLTSAEVSEPSITSVGVERDLVEATSVDATTTVEAATDGDQAVLRVTGSIGSPGTASISTTGGAAAFSLESVVGPGQSEVPFGNGSHHVVVSGVPGASTAVARWSVTDGSGVTVVHDIVVALGT